MNRREFLQGSGWMLGVAAAGCAGSDAIKLSKGGTMCGFRAKPLSRVRVGFAGVGGRGTAALCRVAQIPGCEVVAVCDLRQERLDACNKWLKDNGFAKAREHCGPEAYKAMCDSDDVDVVYVAGSWQMHGPVGIYAANAGKHTFVEVSSALTVDDCWAFVEASERNRVHVMQLENVCYGEAEMLALNLTRLGILGEIIHADGAYIHDLRNMNYGDDPSVSDTNPNRGYYDFWRLRYNCVHKGNQYPTHGLGCACQCMNINRGDRFDFLVSVETGQYNFERYAKRMFPAGDWRAKARVAMGDMNTTVIRTVNDKTIMLQHDVSSPRPYSRINRLSGLRGIFEGCYLPTADSVEAPTSAQGGGCPCRFAWAEKEGGRIPFFYSKRRTVAMAEKYRHPLWKSFGEISKKIGGHGGKDFLMDLRWAYCLQNGLPLDMDVYDLAAWSSVCELSERSVRGGSVPVKVPDFTRGAWKTAAPLGIVDIDPAKLRIEENRLNTHTMQLKV